MSINFKIQRLDPMGQGVHKDDMGVTFIPKTLPGEEGRAVLRQGRKGVHFAEIAGPQEITQVSPDRIAAACPHFDQCPGCHYQHVDYAHELGFKETSLRQHLRKVLGGAPLSVHSSDQRYGTRNRVQLHYDLKANLLGIIKGTRILPVPGCLLPTEAVRQRLATLPEEMKSMHLPQYGHVEVYERDGGVQVTFNAPYAAGGFTQVHQAMNPVLQKIVEAAGRGSELTLDLFGGGGNLSALLAPSPCLVVDAPGPSAGKRPMLPHQRFVPLDLYSKDAVATLSRQLEKGPRPTFMVLDPPRSGLKNIKDFLDAFPVQKLLYVSCWPSTMARDLESIAADYACTEVHLVDLFPATFHYESVTILERVRR